MDNVLVFKDFSLTEQLNNVLLVTQHVKLVQLLEQMDVLVAILDR
jgi:hypothetical protein